LPVVAFAAAATRFDAVIVRQAMSIGSNTAANAKSVLDLVSTSKGFLPPRMTEAQRDAISTPPTGLLVYNTDDNKVNVYNGSGWAEVGGGGGGGGGSLQWIESTNSPLYDVENGVSIYAFESGLAQQLCANVKVPETYQAGGPIKLFLSFYSNDTSGTVLFQTVTTLIRDATDAVTSTTNQRTSTNSAVTLSGATQNEPQTVEFDLSSTIGEVNAVAVAAGDLLFACLKRGTDTATSDAKALVYNSEVTFQ
jgi:hypothetical protein